MAEAEKEAKLPVIELDETQVLRDQVALLSTKLAQAEQMATRHQAISNQLAQQLTTALAKIAVLESEPDG